MLSAIAGWGVGFGANCTWASSGASDCPQATQVPWFKVFELLTARQLVAPGSKWHLQRRWFLSSAMDQLLEEHFVLAGPASS